LVKKRQKLIDFFFFYVTLR